MITVYEKSAAAVKEFEHGIRTLSLKHRQLLIMVNGRRSDVDIAKMFNSVLAVQMLKDLEKLGYLTLVGSRKEIAKHEATTTIEVSLSQEHLVFIKTFLVEEAQLQLGLMSRAIEQKIAQVQNSDDLKSCVARWHMAIRDSRNGRTVADKLMERLAHLMANPPQAMASNKAS
jgi:predicted HAD superfamily phosphohydrolase